MKLLKTYSLVGDAEERCRFLETNGIAAFVSSKRSIRLGRIFTGAFQAGLWVVLDDQYLDAVQLLDNPQHQVARRLSQTEIAEIRQSIDTGDKTVVLNVLAQFLVAAVLFFVIVLVITRL